MIGIRRPVALLVLAGLLLGPAALLGAEESRSTVRAPMILTILALPMDKPEARFRESLRAVPPPRPSAQWQMLPDGSARFGNSTLGVIVRNPCPGHAPVALPDLSSR